MRQVASLIFLIFVMLGCVGSNVKDVKIDTNQNATEYLKFEGRSRGIPSLVAAEIIFPNTNRDSFPLIITQHGSSRDGGSFHSGRGRTDEMSMRLMKQAPKRGFAVASIDAFYGTSIKPGDKTKFPKAAEYAIDLKKILQLDTRIDANRIFYVGFSFGAGQVLGGYSSNFDFGGTQWRAISALEPGCNAVPEPTKRNFPAVIFKGTESHYYPSACVWYAQELRKAGNHVELVMVEGANHFFSTNGKITNGLVFNGCAENPVIISSNGSMKHADGRATDREKVLAECFTKKAGGGLNRKYLDAVLDQTLSFFERYL